MSIPVPPLSEPTPSESSFAACVVGWPATFMCPPGFMWVPPVFTCMPCKAGFYFTNGICSACAVGSYSATEGSTACLDCAYARVMGSSQCTPLDLSSLSVGTVVCNAGYELRGSGCLPCLPGFYKASKGTQVCSACAPGYFSNAAGKSGCLACTVPLVSTQWASTGCILCSTLYIPSAKSNACLSCIPKLQYFYNIRPVPLCMNKTVLSCKSGYYLEDGGASSDNTCVPCIPCAQGQVMVPFSLSLCSYEGDITVVLGKPYRCAPVQSMAGQFSRLSLQEQNSDAFSVQYTPCQGLPESSGWVIGPQPSMCFFQCQYAVAGPISQQYLFYYGMQQPDVLTQNVIQNLGSNVFPLDYPGLNTGLMLMANQVQQ